MMCYICGDGMSYPPADAVAWIRVHPSGNVVRLCQRDLDDWFDDADADTSKEPLDWGWGLIARPPAARRLTAIESAFVEVHQANMAARHRPRGIRASA